MPETPEADNDDVMQQTWCCMACSSTFRFGQIRFKDGPLVCPRCEAASGLQPADGRVEEIAEYHSEIGTRH